MNKKKRQIIQSARQLFIKKGFQDTSIIDIISAANVSKGTFYNHFTSKEQCLLAILEETREEIITKRFEVAMNQSPSDMQVLIKQIALLAHVYRERNLVRIFESLSGSKRDTIHKTFQKFLIQEIHWLAERLIDVYGKKIRELSYECAVQAIGMIQQSYRITLMASQQPPSPEEIATIVMDHIDAMIPKLLQTKKAIMTGEVVQSLLQKIDQPIPSKEEIIEQLKGFNEKLTKNDSKCGMEYSNFLMKEMYKSNVNVYILELVLPAFNHSFRNTSHEAEANEISMLLWRYMHSIKKGKNL